MTGDMVTYGCQCNSSLQAACHVIGDVKDIDTTHCVEQFSPPFCRTCGYPVTHRCDYSADILSIIENNDPIHLVNTVGKSGSINSCGNLSTCPSVSSCYQSAYHQSTLNPYQDNDHVGTDHSCDRNCGEPLIANYVVLNHPSQMLGATACHLIGDVKDIDTTHRVQQFSPPICRTCGYPVTHRCDYSDDILSKKENNDPMHLVNTVDNSTSNSHAVIVSGHQFIAHTRLPAPRIAI